MQVHEILRKFWGYDKFRPMQEEIITSVLEGNDTLALLPTGGGKSICFQVPALALEGICIVVTPLIALMKDQVEQLKKRKIPALSIYSGMNHREIDIALDNCIYGNIKFLYVSPERLKTEIFIERAKRMKVALLAVDEAHCISQWGYDFRPAYLEIAAFRTNIPIAGIIALTASATQVVVDDIQEKLEFKKSKVFKKSFLRTNLSYSSIYEENKEKKLFQILKKVEGTSIIYVRSRKRTQEVAKNLQRNGIRADHYHAGLSNQARSKKQEDWIKNDIRVIVATNAFGMGIDKPDVRTVVHLDLPDTLEAYYQEAGRAGRDEKKAFAVILYNKVDIDNLRTRVLQEYPEVDYIKKVYQCLANYLKIAVGSSNLASFDFDLEDFQRTFNLEPIPSYYALKRIEDEGFIQLNETFFNPSKLFINVDNKTLYEFLIAHANSDHLLKTILRMYGGELFTNFVSVSENEIARNSKSYLSEVTSLLNLLHQKNIVIYTPQNDKPQLTFTESRYDASKLPVNVKALEKRKQRDVSKMESVIHYAEHLNKCRTRLLLEYFDEKNIGDCGVCDNCLNRKKSVNAADQAYVLYRLKILESLRNNNLSIQDLIENIKPSNNKEAIMCLRIMLANGEIKYTEDGKIASDHPGVPTF